MALTFGGVLRDNADGKLEVGSLMGAIGRKSTFFGFPGQRRGSTALLLSNPTGDEP